MRSLLPSSLVLVHVFALTGATVSAAEPVASDDRGPAAAILDAYESEVYRTITPRLGQFKDDIELQTAIGEIAERHLAGQSNTLHEHAAWLLQRAPMLEAPDTADWTLLLHERVEEPEDIAAYDLTIRRGTNPVAARTKGWNPFDIARAYQQIAMARKLGPMAYRTRSIIYSFTRYPKWSVVNADPQRPVLATQTPGEVVVITMQYDADRSCYMLDELI